MNAPLARASDWPPPPHDPRERDRVLLVGRWEIRLFGDHGIFLPNQVELRTFEQALLDRVKQRSPLRS